MHTDPILEEVYRIKDAIGERYNNDPASFWAEIRAIELLHADRIVTSIDYLPIIDPKLNSLEALGIDWDPSVPAWEDSIVAEVRRIRDELYRQKELATAQSEQPIL